MAHFPKTAVILAAGMGTRLRATHHASPKGFLEFGGEALISRSIRLLKRAGIEEILIVAGHMAEAYHALAAATPRVRVIENPSFADTGSMASLACALEHVEGDFLLLESDIIYEPRALTALREDGRADLILLSGPTQAGDEVWVEGRDGSLVAMSKARGALGEVVGELVGVCRISAGLAAELGAYYADRREALGHGRVAYETDALVHVGQRRPIGLCLRPDLIWGEVDDEAHYQRIQARVMPALEALEAGRFRAPPRTILLNPGPATTSEGVKAALIIPDVCPRERSFTDQVAWVRRALAALLGPPEARTTVLFAGSGTAAVEATLASVVPEAGGVLIIDNGDYGARMTQICAALQIPHAVFAPGWGQPIDPEALRRALDEAPLPLSHLALIHHETSSGRLNALEPVLEIAAARGLSVILDAMSSFGALPIEAHPNLDYVISSSNKCVQGMAGLSFVIARRAALETARAVRPRAFYLSLVDQHDALERTGQTRFTCPPQVLSALKRALLELQAEGRAGRGARYLALHHRLRAGLEALGFEALIPEPEQSGILISIRSPQAPWFDFEALHDALFERGFTIYPGKPSAIPNFRLSVLGDLREADIDAFLAHFEALIEAARARNEAR